MDHMELFEAVKALAPDMEICIGMEMWGDSEGRPQEVSWQIYLSVPGTFYRGATPKAAFEAFKAVYSPKEERLIDLAVIDLAVAEMISGRQHIDSQEAMELGTRLATKTRLDPEVCEHLLFWYSRMFPDSTGKAGPVYQTWLTGAVQGKDLRSILADLAPLTEEAAEKVVEAAPAEA